MQSLKSPGQRSKEGPSGIRRIGRAFARHQWAILGALAVASVVLAYVGYRTYYQRAGEPTDPIDLVYMVIQLVWFNSYLEPAGLPWTLRVARLLIPAIVLFAAVKALLILFYDRVEVLRARLLREHTIVCGLGRKGLLLTHRLRALRERVVVIERDRAHRDVAAARDAGALVLHGDAAQAKALLRAGAHRARRLIAVTGDDDQNVAIAVEARGLLTAEGDSLSCLVHVKDLDLLQALGEQRLRSSEAQTFWFEVFNVADGAARAVLSAYPPFDPSPDAVAAALPHVGVVGHGSLAESLIAHAGRRWQMVQPGRRLPMTLLDDHGERTTARLLARYEHLANTCDFTHIQRREGEFPHMRLPRDGSGRPLTSIVYVCGEIEGGTDWAVALRIEQALREHDVPVVLCTMEAGGVAALVRSSRSAALGGLHVVPALEAACDPDLLFGGLRDELARAIHDEYVRNERAKPVGPSRKPDDDRAMCAWSDLDEDLRDQNRDVAADIHAKLDMIGCGVTPLVHGDEPAFEFSADEVEQLSRREHERWMRYKAAQGYRYADLPTPNVEAKLHPDMLPWDELDEPTKQKDRDSVVNIPRLVQMAGCRIYRRK